MIELAEKIIRPSSLPAWQDCARRQAARMFRALILETGYALRTLPSQVGAHVGTGVHAGVASGFRHKMAGGSLGPTDEAMDAAVQAFDERCVADGVAWDKVTADRNTAQRQILRMTRAHREHLAPHIDPVEVEERKPGDVGGGWTISGQADQRVETPGGIHDLKTGTIKRQNMAQYGAYTLLFRAHGLTVVGICEDFVARVRVDKPQPLPEVVHVPVDVAVEEAWTAIEDVKRAADGFVRAANDPHGPPPHLAFRANPMSVLCSDKFCPAWGTNFCRAHRGAK